MSKKYTFREITEKEELEELFKMRYEIYSECKLNGFVKKNKYKIDIDYYDINSRHYALFYNNSIVGCLRVVLPKDIIFQDRVLEIGRKYSMMNGSYNTTIDKLPFPFLGYDETPQSYWDYYNSCSLKNEKFIEASRLILHPEHRTIRSSKFLIECAMVDYILLSKGLNHAIISCIDNHSSFYKHYGFCEINNSDGNQFPGVIGTTLSIPLTISSIPQKHHTRFHKMANEFKANNKIERTF